MSTRIVDESAGTSQAPDRESLDLLQLSAAATQKAFRSVIDRKVRWVAYSLESGDLDLGNDDYRELCAALAKSHGDEYLRQFSIIGPLF